MQASVAKVVGLPTGSAWAQIHTFVPPEQERELSCGRLIAVIALKNVSGGITGVELGREVLSRLHEEYFGKEDGSVLERISGAVSRVSEEFSSLSPEIAASILWKEYVYFCVLGQGAVFLSRDGRFSRLLTGEPEKIVCISGQGKQRDLFLLGTESFLQAVGPSSLAKTFLKAGSPQEIADEFAPFAQKSGGAAAAAVVQITDITGEEKEEAEEELVETRPSLSPKIQVPLKGLKEKARSFTLFLAAKLPDKGVYIKRNGSSRRTAVSVGIILLALLFVSIFFGIKQKGLKEYRSSYDDRLGQAESLYSDSLLQKTVNSQAAKEMFLQAEDIAKQLEGEGVKDDRLKSLGEKINTERASVLGIVEARPVVFHDLSLVRTGVSAKEMALDGEIIAVLDGGGGRVISVSTETKETKVGAGRDKAGEMKAIALYSGRFFTLGDKGVVESDSRGSVKVVVNPDPEASEVKKIDVFGGNLYLFSQNGEVWRYPAVEGGFGTKQRWLGSGVSAESAQGADFSIDGSIWVLSANGKVAKFTRGAPDSFRLIGMDKEFSNPTSLYTDEGFDSIFVFDRGNTRVVEMGKDGVYRKQYVLGDMGEIGEIKDIAASKKAGKIFLLTETKILEVPLN